MKKQLVTLIIMMGLFLIPIATSAQVDLSPEDIDRIGQSVVLIQAMRNGEPIATGSGTIVTTDGQIYTNRHVLENADDFAIFMLEDPNELPVLRYFAQAELVFPYGADDVYLDFATLQINRDANGNAILRRNLSLPAIDTSEFRTMRRGDRLFVFGYPGIGNGYQVFTEGIVTTVQNSTVADNRIPTWYQTGAEIAPGNSGGLVVDSNGIPVGIPTAVNSDDRTSTSLGGILPFDFVQTAITGGIPPQNPIVLITGNDTNTTSTSTEPSGEQSVSIEITDIQFGVTFEDDDNTYAAVHAEINAIGYLGVDLRAAVFFYWNDGTDLEPLSSELSDYATPSGSLTQQEVINPNFENTIWEDFIFYIPMNAFPAVTTERTGVAIADISIAGAAFDAPSNQWNFTVTPPVASGHDGFDITCPDGAQIEDGVAIVVVGMRPGFNYTATVIGIDDFDPILAVTTFDNIDSGQATLCNDDSTDADAYSVNLPTTGLVNGNSLSSQQVFNHNSSGMLDIALVIGEFGGNSGEFVLLIEGMAATSADGLGDPFRLEVTPNLAASPTPIAMYMIGAEVQLDPLFYLYNRSEEAVLTDNDGNPYLCNDANTASCYRQSANIAGSGLVVANGRTIRADERDAMMMLPFQFDMTMDESFPIILVMTSNQQQSTGQYVLAFHLGIEE
ncbi:MAG: serine protease [Anaerolineae bacterium]|nr:serine protease [Anaerolineae bacterium]MDQ7033550.1 serine protease [Anaerolineae bacterium]